MAEEVKLEPCPSGHKEGATRSPRSNGAYWEIVCNADGCGWYITGDTEADAIAAWNRRAPKPTEEINREMYAKLDKVANWLEGLAKDAENAQKTCRFESLNEAYRADARNYRATAADIRIVLAKYDSRKGSDNASERV